MPPDAVPDDEPVRTTRTTLRYRPRRPTWRGCHPIANGQSGILKVDGIVEIVGTLGKLEMVTFDGPSGSSGSWKLSPRRNRREFRDVNGVGLRGGGVVAWAVPIRPWAPTPTIAAAAVKPGMVLMFANRTVTLTLRLDRSCHPVDHED